MNHKGEVDLQNREAYTIRIATPADAAELLDIYAPYVEETAITFEYTVPSLEEFRTRITKTLQNYPYIVVQKENEIVGYAYTGSFKGRAAYDWSVETSIYMKKTAKGQGYGKKLYQVLENLSKAQHITNMNACIAYPDAEDAYLTKDSVRFHEHMGYQMVGTFHNCAFKFGRWYHMVWMEKMLGEHPKLPEQVIPFRFLNQETINQLIL